VTMTSAAVLVCSISILDTIWLLAARGA